MKYLLCIFAMVLSTPTLVAQQLSPDTSFSQQNSYASNPALHQHHSLFGWDVALYGNYAAILAVSIGALRDHDPDACYVFEASSNRWAFVQRIVPQLDTPQKYALQRAVTINGDYLVLGVSLNNDRHCAVIFHRDPATNTWHQQQILYPPTPAAESFFASGIAMNDKYIFIGSASENTDASGRHRMTNAGAVFSYHLSNGHWDLEQKITPRDRTANQFFGSMLKAGNHSLIIGVPSGFCKIRRSETYVQSGAAYIFRLNVHGKPWIQEARLSGSDPVEKDMLGTSVAVHGRFALVGAPNKKIKKEGDGCAYLYQRNWVSGRWHLRQKITASDQGRSGGFGYSLALSENVLIAGSYWQDSMAGASYVFSQNRLNHRWQEKQILVAPARKAGDLFSLGIALSGNNAILSAYGQGQGIFNYEHTGDRGVVYFYRLTKQQ